METFDNANKQDDILNTKVTIFPNIRDVNHPHIVTLKQVFKRIKRGSPAKEKILNLRGVSDKKERDKLKAELPSICFSGQFSYRNKRGITEHSGLVCVDFDHFKTEKDLSIFRESLKSNRYVLSFFTSPSGDGLKVIVRIPKDINNHEKYVESLEKYFTGILSSGQNEELAAQTWDDLKDVSRVCYESYDPDIYFNRKARLYDIITKEKPVVPQYVPDGKKIEDQNEIYRRIKLWAESRNQYYDGNKHNFLVMFAAAGNRYALEPDLLAKKLIASYQDKASWVDSGDFYDIVKRVYITYEHQHGIASFTTAGESLDYIPEERAKDVIYLDEISEQMWSSFKLGDARGETTYFKTIDNHWRWKRGDLTLMHGIPNHGKSIMMLQLMLLKSINDGVKWGVFSPEQNPPIDFYKDLIHMYIGKSTETHHKYRMNDQEFQKGMDFMMEHFYFVFPKDDSPTPKYISERFEELKIKENISGCVIDPFNQLDNDWAKSGGRDDHYIASFLSKEKRFALDHDMYKIIIAHPKGGIDVLTEKNQDKMFKNAGNHREPDLYDLAGGAMWNNKCDNMLVTYQPYFKTRMLYPYAMQGEKGECIISPETQSVILPYHPRTTRFTSQKIKKPKLNGFPGSTNLVFNIKQFRYYDVENYEEYDETFHNPEMIGIPVEGIYSPFDKEYKENIVKEKLSEKIDDTKWEDFIKNNKIKQQEKLEKESSDKQSEMMKELGYESSEGDSGFIPPDYEVDLSEYYPDDFDFSDDDINFD